MASEKRNDTKDAAGQTDDDPFLGIDQELPGAPAMKKRKAFESAEEQAATTGLDGPSQKKAKQSCWSRPVGMPVVSVNPEFKAVAAKLLDRSRMKLEAESRQPEAAASSSAGGGCSGASPAVFATRPLPLRCPPRHKESSWEEYNRECRRISKLVAQDPLTKLLENLPTSRKPDPGTRDAVASSKDKEMVLRLARSIVSVSSIAPDGKVIWQCTGIVVGWDEAWKRARILTSYYHIVRDNHKPKIHVCLPNKSVSEVQLLFFNKHYNLVLLEITTDFPLQLPSFGSSPNYGQEVFVLGRDKYSFLLSRHGTISWRDKPAPLSHNYHMFLSCKIAGCNGAPVIDHDGNVIGMAFHCMSEHPSMLLPISTILTCIEMWREFSRITRPSMHGLRLRSVELLDVSSREMMSYYSSNIKSGYVVDKVGIRHGDIIVSFDELGIHPLPKLEDLLALGWEFLERGFDAITVVDLKLEVYDQIENCMRSIILPVGFCDAPDVADIW